MNVWLRVLLFVCADVFGSLALAQATQGNFQYAAGALAATALFLLLLFRVLKPGSASPDASGRPNPTTPRKLE